MTKNISLWYRKFKIHILIWSLYMVIEALSIGIIYSIFHNAIIYISHYLIVVIFFYIHADICLPWVIKQGKQIWFTLLVLALELPIYVMIQYLVSYVLEINGFKTGIELKLDVNFVSRNLYRGLLFLCFSTGYYYLKTYLKERKRTADLEKEKLEKIIQQQKIEQELVIAKNAFLKAQINPHFLFNTLDFIYHSVNKHSETAGEAVIRLAQMMRFAIDSDEMEQTIYLTDEIEQVENLLYLYQIRKNSELNLHFAYSEEVKRLRLIPLVVLTLVENIFKHGDISNADDIAFVNLEIKNDLLIIQTVNLINHNTIKDSNNSGLNNTQKRLNYAYGDEIIFKHEVINKHFKVDIKIPIRLLK
ncbi:sensor histidine kinase [Pedobacter frigiditerrae]|uniref:sensor histidine kinase n=1 Tax=Pedobacter frigiditerrae TaxID=2530452 RepID=UPI0029305FE7|nr:sensor histidine kinase [Pedobacter frigiditerrae]